MRTTASRYIKCECMMLTFLLGLSLVASGETIDEGLTVNGTLNVQADAVFNGELWGSKICGMNNPSDPEKGAVIDFSVPSSTTYGQSLVLTGGEGRYVGGTVTLKAGRSFYGSLANIVLTGSSIVLDGNVKLDGLTGEGPVTSAFKITGRKGLGSGPADDPQEGQDVVISGGQGARSYTSGQFMDNGSVTLVGQTIDLEAVDSVVVASSMDMQGNTLENVRIEPCGGLLMGEFDSE